MPNVYTIDKLGCFAAFERSIINIMNECLYGINARAWRSMLQDSDTRSHSGGRASSEQCGSNCCHVTDLLSFLLSFAIGLDDGSESWKPRLS